MSRGGRARRDGKRSLDSQKSSWFLREAAHMVVGIAKELLGRDEPLEVVADAVFLGHTHSPMQLDAQAAHDPSGVGRHNFGRRDGAAACGRLRLDIGKTAIEYGASLLYLDEHLCEAVLRRLELQQRLTELGA